MIRAVVIVLIPLWIRAGLVNSVASRANDSLAATRSQQGRI
jgi:hypothetical protein